MGKGLSKRHIIEMNLSNQKQISYVYKYWWIFTTMRWLLLWKKDLPVISSIFWLSYYLFLIYVKFINQIIHKIKGRGYGTTIINHWTYFVYITFTDQIRIPNVKGIIHTYSSSSNELFSLWILVAECTNSPDSPQE